MKASLSLLSSSVRWGLGGRGGGDTGAHEGPVHGSPPPEPGTTQPGACCLRDLESRIRCQWEKKFYLHCFALICPSLLGCLTYQNLGAKRPPLKWLKSHPSRSQKEMFLVVQASWFRKALGVPCSGAPACLPLQADGSREMTRGRTQAALLHSGVLALSTSFPLSSFPLPPCPHDTGWGPQLLGLPQVRAFPQWRHWHSSLVSPDRGPFVTGAISSPRMAGPRLPLWSAPLCAVQTQCPCDLDTRVSSPRPTGVSSHPLQKRGASASLHGPQRRGQRSCPAWR